MVLTILFQRRPVTLIGKLICLWTRGPYYHVAMVFDDRTTIEAIQVYGTRKVLTENIDFSVWDSVEIEVTREEKETILGWAQGELGAKYDWMGVICAQVFGIPREHPTRWFCSEFIVAALQRIGRLTCYKPCTVSPNHLYRILTSRT